MKRQKLSPKKICQHIRFNVEKQLVGVSYDDMEGLIELFDYASSKCHKEISGVHFGKVIFEFSHNGEYIISRGSLDKTVIVYEIDTTAEIYRYKCDYLPTSLSFSQDDKFILFGSLLRREVVALRRDEEFAHWRLLTGSSDMIMSSKKDIIYSDWKGDLQVFKSYQGRYCTFSPSNYDDFKHERDEDGNYVYPEITAVTFANWKQIVFGFEDGICYIGYVNIQHNERILWDSHCYGCIFDIAVSPDESFIALYHEGCITIWDFEYGDFLDKVRVANHHCHEKKFLGCTNNQIIFYDETMKDKNFGICNFYFYQNNRQLYSDKIYEILKRFPRDIANKIASML